MKTVFDPIELNHLNASNRLVRSATWEGIAAPWHWADNRQKGALCAFPPATMVSDDELSTDF